MSGEKATFRKVQQFQPDADLQRQLSEFEGNAEDAIRELGFRMLERLRVTSLKTAYYAAKLGEMVPCGGTFPLLLPTASKANAGRAVAVVRKSGTVTVTANGSQVQGAATDALSTNGLRIYFSDGQDWWRAP